MDLGGIETFLINLLRNINKEKIQFDFALTKTDCYYCDEIKKMGGKIYKVSSPKKGLKKYKKELEKVIEENGPYDVIQSHSYLFNGIIMKIGKKKSIKTRISHSHTSVDNKNNSFNIKRKAYQYYMRYLIRKNATLFFGCTKEANISLHGNNLPSEKVEIIKNGIIVSNYNKVSTIEKEQLKKELNIPNNAKIIGHIGRFSPVKNQSFIIKIFNIILNKKDDYYLLLVGEGYLLEDIKNEARNLGIYNNIRFLGLRKDIPQILSILDIFIFPSFYEGLGISLVEAQAAGVQSIISEKIPKEAIIIKKLIEVKKLSEGPEEWADLILNNSRTYISAKETKKKIIENGYDINEVCKLLERKYYIKK